ncbi:hypothetical protein SODALDRAFT_283328 [Sodiomyces alkalinus F11]|uniref:T6SS Phospholipase effector Tle1-like catalytic domain-containing protein n=1 Tax=Sodiomyces alkalinus (strain CBS 110278 / VKM F-3762 / F11) TaxID=1314773 RepID=A0A3N2PNR4_SODAK|nr:hypothetical protein SODALDRAFT_283328 [Sodiomyces alkalinus F11]ROT36142.1 hypothetical protein SODALDRAFT_283328 [Sodiomyces alkalinus F11]
MASGENSEGTSQSNGLAVRSLSAEGREPKKLILCFDGTGNAFTGSNADTNVVKLLQKLDRNAPNQYHYYQTGIGTYDVNETSVNKSWFGQLKSSMSQTIDQGIGTTFDAHVMAGYRFLMRYYDPGDRIYMFGFSRGAFTAKFLARMIHTVGLLCKGNEEMVPFAFRLYQRYLAGETEDFLVAHPKGRRTPQPGEPPHKIGTDANPVLDGHAHHDDGNQPRHGRRFGRARDEITAFSNTFCRNEEVMHCGVVEQTNIKVYFLGIWDCVNSVAVLEKEAPVPVPVKGTAHFVRHAVAVDERRVKFKPALLAQDIRGSDHNDEDIKEVWFPGCHGDVGGGWPASEDNPLDTKKNMSFWQRITNFWTSRKATAPSRDIRRDPFQLSDIPLAWMIRELELVGELDPAGAVKWCKSVNGFKRRFQKRKEQALRGALHDSLTFGQGTGFFKVLFWKWMGKSKHPWRSPVAVSVSLRLCTLLGLEWLPTITRWELENNEWVNVRFPLNKGHARDIPTDAVLHESLIWRLKNDPAYGPLNNHGGRLPPCLKNKDCVSEFEPALDIKGQSDPDHQVYQFASAVQDRINGN